MRMALKKCASRRWDDLRKIFSECQRVAKVPNGVEILPKILTRWLGRTNVTDDRQTTNDRRTGDSIMANVNLSSRSLKMKWHYYKHERLSLVTL